MAARDPFPALDLRAILEEEYGMPGAAPERLPRGHTNASFGFAGADGRRFVLRQSWRGKPLEQVAREEAILAHLAARRGPPVPRLVPTRSGLPRATVPLDGAGPAAVLHLFEGLPGDVAYDWHEGEALARSPRRRRAVLGALAGLHGALAGAPVDPGGDPLARLRSRMAGIEEEAKGGKLALGPPVDGAIGDFLGSARAILDRALDLPWAEAPLRWCHGDFQLENILFVGDEISGVVDFDSLLWTRPEVDLAFALFGIARSRADEAFRWDEGRWEDGLGDYREAAAPLGIEPSEGFVGAGRRALLKDLFCLDQALQHLDCARKGIWELREEIGFLPCWREVLSSPAADRGRSEEDPRG
jgi:Ser/Thr protein kinase RdoA (MazF antagonist)